MDFNRSNCVDYHWPHHGVHGIDQAEGLKTMYFSTFQTKAFGLIPKKRNCGFFIALIVYI